jgi:hypothetical protein
MQKMAFNNAKGALLDGKRPPFAKQTAANIAHISMQTLQHSATHALTFAHEKRPYFGLRHFILRKTCSRKPVGKQYASKQGRCRYILATAIAHINNRTCG